jgi:hypothetical protein
MFDARFSHRLSQLLENLIGSRKFYRHVSCPEKVRYLAQQHMCQPLLHWHGAVACRIGAAFAPDSLIWEAAEYRHARFF